MPIKFRWPQDINAIRFGATLVWGVVNGIITTIQGTSPLALVNAVAGRIKSLVQYGKCTTVDDEIYCNNGKLVAVDDELPAGYKRLLGITFDSNIRYETGEALTGDDDVTMTLDNLSSSGKNVFGSYNGANGKNFSLYIYGSASTGSYFRFGDQLKRPKYGTGKRTITFGKSGTSGFDSDSDVTPDEFTTPANVYIGMLPNSSSAAYAGDIIGSIIVSNRLEWIPCERESDGVIGYYEKYNGNFLEPVGSGSPVSLGYDTSHLTVLSVDGTPEVLMVTGEESESLSGDIVSFEVNKPSVVSALNVNVEPIQDLHGYDNPWPAGGGVNLLPFDDVLTEGWTNTENGITATYSKGIMRVTGTSTSTGWTNIVSYASAWYNNPIMFGPGSYAMAENIVIASAVDGSGYNNKPVPFTADESVQVRGFYIAVNAGQTVDWTIPMMFVKGTTRPATYAPYSNICPISGRTSATVTRTGKNLLDASDITDYSKWSADIAPSGDMPSSRANRIYSLPKLVPGVQYTISFGITSASFPQYLYFGYHKDGVATRTDYITTDRTASQSVTFTALEGVTYCLRMGLTSNQNNFDAQIAKLSYIQLELGSTASAYEPYQGNTYTIQLGETVYGGTLDVTVGKMVVDRVLFMKNTADMGNASAYPGWKDAGLKALGYTGANVVSNTLLNIGTKFSYNCNNNNDILFLSTSHYNKTQEEWIALAMDVQIVVPLVTPIEITLTPTQIETLIGTNNIWADTGSIESLKYKAMQTASVENLFAVDDIADEQNIISGTVTRRCEAVVSDGTTPSGRYIGEVGDGNIIVKVRETGYEGDVATFEADRAKPLNGLTVNVEPIQAGSGDPSPDNVRPISGRTSATVTRTGKNLLKNEVESSTVSGVTCTRNQDGSLTFSGTADGLTYFILDPSFDSTALSGCLFYPTFENALYPLNTNGCCFRICSQNSFVSLQDLLTDSHGTFVKRTVADKGNNLRFTIRFNKGYVVPEGFTVKPMIVLPTETDFTYEPYKGNTYTIQLGDTVYGGTLDVTAGKIVVDRAMVDLGTLEYYYVSSGSVNAFRSNIGARPVTNNSQHGITSIYPFAGTRFTSNMPNLSWMIDSQGRLFIRDDRYTDISSFVAYLSGQTIVYELATPIEITLTPTQIETLIGQNNVWSDAGAVKAYVADSALIEHVTSQPMRTAEGDNTVSVTSAVDPVQLEIDYYKNE